MITMKDIAQMAGVSRGTVDRVLNNREGVNEQTAERVRKIAQSLNYEPSAAGRNLAVRKKKLKFGFIMPEFPPSSPVEREVKRKSIQLEEYGISVLTKYTGRGDYGQLLRAVEQLEEEHVSGIVLPPVDHPEVIKKLEAIHKKKLPVVTYENDIPGIKRLAHVGCNYYQCGRTVGGMIKLLLNGNGRVGIASGSVSAKEHGARLDGCCEKLRAEAPGITVAHNVVCAEDEISTYLAVKEILEQTPPIDLLFLNVVSSFGAMRAVEEWGKPLRVVSTNRVTELADYLQRGLVSAVITHQPWLQGSMPLDILFAYKVWGSKPTLECYYTNNEIVTADNIKAMYDGMTLRPVRFSSF